MGRKTNLGPIQLMRSFQAARDAEAGKEETDSEENDLQMAREKTEGRLAQEMSFS